ncbi:uncharacterized protein PODANS_1_16520 [Podospora anserina S mat+]|uniref:Podospora anserina S mat+ genomic DNA chromosome 1, supercontig 4 n=1 Tax=Podospora anserina (strain S / ATCC MYA-4624 / DSM 980 / FGSC 10383) TaxID=515849 RepID=B2ATP4_PODAN|nr:uncharacterized protein PODANS_1_16520 [Podospora anserina S mat+]CAP67767.1 unnamed protein product [Podospora anserina S mat+]CDP24024.1 Putative protein of unknown function [Podospora anserina S mat+]
MPVTIKTGNTWPEAWDRELKVDSSFRRENETGPQYVNPKATSSSALLAGVSHEEHSQSKGILQCSLAFDDKDLADSFVSPSNNGFVNTMVHAYSYHHHVVLRPEDIWFAILTQLSFYMNKNAEALRSLFVAHEGKKELSIEMDDQGGGLENVDFGVFAKKMTHLLQENVLDPDFRQWIIPNFTTTTDNDLVVGSILMMGGLKEYFAYTCYTCCGMPSVTLLGERVDYEKILKRLDGLPRLGKEPTTFGLLLGPIIRRFIASFDNPRDPDVLSFWARSVDRESDSGTDDLTGWISAFCFWDSLGQCTYDGDNNWPSRLTLDGVKYGYAKTEEIPNGFAAVPVKIVYFRDEIHSRMVAGSVGIRGITYNERFGVDDSVPASASGRVTPLRDTIQPVVGWWIYRTENDTKGVNFSFKNRPSEPRFQSQAKPNSKLNSKSRAKQLVHQFRGLFKSRGI